LHCCCGPTRSHHVFRRIFFSNNIANSTDVYTLDNFGSLKTLLETIRASQEGNKVVSMLTGDFLAPYLLSSVDRGAGMMNAITETPIDILTWG